MAEPKTVTAIIGPSGCGKSTLIRCMNRMHEEVQGARVEGKVLFDGHDIYGPDVDPVEVRRRIGMVFQRPNPFPTMSIFDNAVAGVRLGAGRISKADLQERAEQALRSAGLWDEVKDRLQTPGGGCRAASSSASASRGRWRWSRRSCSWTSPPRRWTPPRPSGSRSW